MICEQCGGPLTRGKRGPAQRFCSAACRARASYDRSKADGRYQARLAVSASQRVSAPRTTKVCPYCEQTFETAWPERDIVCSEKCRRAKQSRRVRPYVDHRRQVVRAGEDFDRQEIFERDGWRCQICDGEIDPLLQHPDPLSASVDHIVPLARGGEHTRSNVRCAHLVCNNRRGTRDDSELVLAPMAQVA